MNAPDWTMDGYGDLVGDYDLYENGYGFGNSYFGTGGNGGWTLTVGNATINYNNLPNGSTTINFQNGNATTVVQNGVTVIGDSKTPGDLRIPLKADPLNTWAILDDGPGHPKRGIIAEINAASGLTANEGNGGGGPDDPKQKTDSPLITVIEAQLAIWGAGIESSAESALDYGAGAVKWVKGLGIVGNFVSAGITINNIRTEGPTTSNEIDAFFSGVAFVPDIGWAISGTYWIGNAVTKGITGQSIGQNLDERYYIIPFNNGGTGAAIFIPK